MSTPLNNEQLRAEIDKAISLYVNRGLIHEDRWTDLKDGLMALFNETLATREVEKRIDENKQLLKLVKPEDKHAGGSWWRGYASAQMKVRKVIKDRLSALQQSSKDNPYLNTSSVPESGEDQ